MSGEAWPVAGACVALRAPLLMTVVAAALTSAVLCALG